MFYKIICSNCGKHRRLSFPMEDKIWRAINLGWSSCGDALYCPECAKTWHHRNPDRYLDGNRHTHDMIECDFLNSIMILKG